MAGRTFTCGAGLCPHSPQQLAQALLAERTDCGLLRPWLIFCKLPSPTLLDLWWVSRVLFFQELFTNFLWLPGASLNTPEISSQGQLLVHTLYPNLALMPYSTYYIPISNLYWMEETG